MPAMSPEMPNPPSHHSVSSVVDRSLSFSSQVDDNSSVLSGILPKCRKMTRDIPFVAPRNLKVTVTHPVEKNSEATKGACTVG